MMEQRKVVIVCRHLADRLLCGKPLTDGEDTQRCAFCESWLALTVEATRRRTDEIAKGSVVLIVCGPCVKRRADYVARAGGPAGIEFNSAAREQMARKGVASDEIAEIIKRLKGEKA